MFRSFDNLFLPNIFNELFSIKLKPIGNPTKYNPIKFVIEP